MRLFNDAVVSILDHSGEGNNDATFESILLHVFMDVAFAVDVFHVFVCFFLCFFKEFLTIQWL